MSLPTDNWSNFQWDPFSPKVIAKLNSTNIALKGGKITEIPYQNTCWTGCQIHPNACNPDISNQCPSSQNFLGEKDKNIQKIDSSVYNCPSVGEMQTWNDEYQLTETQLCGSIDDVNTCTLGTRGIGMCRTKDCVYNTDWTSDINLNGYCFCSYNYDFSNFNYSKVSDLWNYVRDMYQGTSNSANQGMDVKQKNRIRDSNFIYACCIDFYNQIYKTGSYANPNNPQPNQ